LILARYCCLVLLPALAAVALSAAARATAPDGLVLEYRVLRDGFEIGRHKVAFRHDGDAVMTVETEIRITVSFLFITLYSYRLDARETWRGERLVGLDSTTDDDGDLYAVSAVAEGDGLRVEAGAKSWTAPATVVPSSLWRREMARGSLLIGVEQGEAIAVAFEEIGRETVTARGAEVIATKVVVSGELERRLWYDDDGILVHLRLIARDGSSITYELE
jgi:hypothetical protein